MLGTERAVVVRRPLFSGRAAYLTGLKALVLDCLERRAEFRADVVEALLWRGIEVDARVLTAGLDPVVVARTSRVVTTGLVCAVEQRIPPGTPRPPLMIRSLPALIVSMS
jgi:hypothetical protein